jgi:hypothetical protein
MRNSRPLMVSLGVLAALLVGLLLTATASAKKPRNVDYGFVEDQFADKLLTNPDASIRNEWWNRAKATNSKTMRINLYWSQTASSRPFVPRNHLDPNYDWSVPDRALLAAKQRGIDVVLTVFLAPRWAEGSNRPSEDQARAGTWRPNADAFGDFAHAVATRYNGKFFGLPKVKWFEAWNEPNIPQYLTPQWDGKKPVTPDIYRELLNSFYAGVNAANNPGAKVVTAGTSPIGDKRGGKRMRPYFFWREVMCLKHNKKLKKNKKCAGKGKDRARFDVYAHNAINAGKNEGPRSKPRHRDDGVPANFKALTKIVNKARKQKTILPKKKKQGWSTETWYESKPGQPNAASPKKQARLMQEALYVLWKQKVSRVFFLQLRDSPYDPKAHRLANFQTGVYKVDNKPKPSLKAVRFPFVADRKSRKKVTLWGISPKGGKVTIKRGKRTVKKVKTRKGKVFVTNAKLKKGKGKHKLRAQAGKKHKSLVWKQK